MMKRRLLALPILAALLAGVPDGRAQAPEPAAITVLGAIGEGVPFATTALAALPSVSVAMTAESGRQVSYEGPLLWAVLEQAKAVDAGKAREFVRDVALVTGRDGYSAAIALGEIAPGFEGKQVIVALRMDGQPLAPEHLRLVVPGDRRGGRSVRDLVRLAIVSPQPR